MDPGGGSVLGHWVRPGPVPGGVQPHVPLPALGGGGHPEVLRRNSSSLVEFSESSFGCVSCSRRKVSVAHLPGLTNQVIRL